MIVASYNVHKCRGTDGRYHPERVTEVIADLRADVVALQEADRRHGRRVGLLDETGLARHAGLRLVPVSDVAGGHGWHGNALLVRDGIRLARPVTRLRLPGLEPRGAVVADLESPAGRLRVVAVHMGLLPGCRILQAREILSALGAAGWSVPCLVMGDLNEWRPEGSALGALAPRFGRPCKAPSFPSTRPMLSLDRILGFPAGLVRKVEVHDTPLSRKASDHLPLRAEVSMTSSPALSAARR